MVDTIKKNNLFFRQLLFLGILILIGVLIFNQLSFFIGSFLGAITLYIVFRQSFFHLTQDKGWKPWLAALMFAAIAAIVVVGLLFGIFRLIASEFQNMDFASLGTQLSGLMKRLDEWLPFNIVPQDILHESSSFLTNAASSVVNTTYSFVINVLLMILILYFMLANATKLEKKVNRYSPFKGESRHMLTEEITGIIYSNAVGIPLIMLGQGLMAGLLYWAFGMNNVVFWAFLTAVAGLIPMVGTIIVSVPLGISFIMDGFVLKGILLMAIGLFVIANVDNLLRIVLNKKISNTHPLIVIFGVIMGIPMFGFWGIIFGPLFLSVFLLLIRIYYLEFKLITPKEAREDMKEEEEAATERDTPNLMQ